MAVIVAGGRGTRLRPAYAARPKCLAPLAGRPFLHWQLDFLRDQGAPVVHLCLGYGSEEVIRSVGEWSRSASRAPALTWTVEPEERGTGGAVRHAASNMDDFFLVFNGDSYTPIDLAWLADRAAGRPTMTVWRNEDFLVRSNVEVRRHLVVRYDKDVPAGTLQHVDYGVIALTLESVTALPAGRRDLSEILQPLIDAHALRAAEVDHRFYEIGTPDSWRVAEERFRIAGPPPVRAGR